MKMIFHSHANKIHFHKKGFALSLVLKSESFVTRKWPINRTIVLLEVFRWSPLTGNKVSFGMSCMKTSTKAVEFPVTNHKQHLIIKKTKCL